MELREYVAALARHRILLVAPVLVAILVVLGWALVAGPVQTSTVTLYAGRASSSTTADEARIQTYVALAGSDKLATAVASDLGAPPGSVRGAVVGDAVPGTLLLTLTASDPSAARAQRIAASAGDRLVDLAASLDPASAGDAAPRGAGTAAADRADAWLTVAQPATRPTSDARARLVGRLALALVLGLVAGAAASLTRDALRRTVSDASTLSRVTGVRTLAEVPDDSSAGPAAVLRSDADGMFAESFRWLRGRLIAHDGPEPPTCLVVTGTARGDGATTVACGLALAFAGAGLRVLVVGADLRGSGVASQLWRREAPGLAEVLRGEAALEEVLQPWADGSLTVLAAGRAGGDAPGDVLGSDAMRSLLDAARSSFDMVLVEAPPTPEFVDAALLAAGRGVGVLLVARHRRTRVDLLARAVAALDGSGAVLLGSVLARVPTRPRVRLRPRRAAPTNEHVPARGRPATVPAGVPATVVEPDR